MRGIRTAIGPVARRSLRRGGAGPQRVIDSWEQLAGHADAPCERCQPIVQAVRRRNRAPSELLEGCCDVGQALVRVWMAACLDLVDRLIARQSA